MSIYKSTTYIGISRDHSGSMSSIAKNAMQDFNDNIASIRTASLQNNQETFISVVECGYGDTASVQRVIVNENVDLLNPLSTYSARGRGTPLFDSVGELIEIFEKVPTANDIDTSFLVMIITDGEENASRKYNAPAIAAKIKQLQSTDRWTFVFRVPRGMGRQLARMGIPEGNILEWDQTAKGVAQATAATQEAFTQYYSSRSMGVTATTKFYANLKDVTSEDVAKVLTDISKEVMFWPVSAADNNAEIRPFVESRLNGAPMLKGAAFYQLTKTEPTVQDNKKIIIQDKTTNAVYYGDAARTMLGLPTYGNVRLAPGDHGNFNIFIQSTSVNRKLAKGTQVLYWSNVGVKYKEGISAR